MEGLASPRLLDEEKKKSLATCAFRGTATSPAFSFHHPPPPTPPSSLSRRITGRNWRLDPSAVPHHSYIHLTRLFVRRPFLDFCLALKIELSPPLFCYLLFDVSDFSQGLPCRRAVHMSRVNSVFLPGDAEKPRQVCVIYESFLGYCGRTVGKRTTETAGRRFNRKHSLLLRTVFTKTTDTCMSPLLKLHLPLP